MVDTSRSSLACEARAIFDRMKASFETSHLNQFVAIEPISGEWFFGTTLSDAIGAARTHYPDRLAHAFRVGHKATVHFGLHIQ